MTTAAAAAAAGEDQWFILAAVPKVVESYQQNRVFLPHSPFSLAFNSPPRASVLSVRRLPSTDPTNQSHPHVAAVHRSGVFLLCATQPPSPDLADTSGSLHYWLCDPSTGEVVDIRAHHGPLASSAHGANVGLVVRGGDRVIVELQLPAVGTGRARATLLCCNVDRYERKWVERELAYSPPPLERPWRFDGVVPHDGMVWWVDLSYGLLGCDPLGLGGDDALPELLHVPLPHVLPEPDDEAPVDPAARVCVRVSGGAVRCVRIHAGEDGAPVVSMWELVHPAAWIHEHSVPLAGVWDDPSYAETALTRSVPALALLHPMDAGVVYFFLGKRVFGVDLRTRKVVACDEFSMPRAPKNDPCSSSSLVQAWRVAPAAAPRLPEGTERTLKRARVEYDETEEQAEEERAQVEYDETAEQAKEEEAARIALAVGCNFDKAPTGMVLEKFKKIHAAKKAQLKELIVQARTKAKQDQAEEHRQEEMVAAN